jgi:hypothetical protein
LDPKIVETIQKHILLLEGLIKFIGEKRLNLYLSMRRFLDTPLNGLITFDTKCSDDARAFKDKLESKKLLEDWGSTYDQFRELAERHKLEYGKAHKECQSEVDDAIGGLIQWAEKINIDSSKLKSSTISLKDLGCSSGKEGSYDENEFLCSVCKRTLSTIRNHEGLVRSKLNIIKEALLAELKEKDKPIYDSQLSSTKILKKPKDLEGTLTEVSDFARYWLGKGKKVKLRVEGETEGG